MELLPDLFDNNRRWAERRLRDDPQFFARLSALQAPPYLWIGCSDSRVPANEIVGLLPGELFVHRNVANVVVHSDLNCLSVLTFAVEVLSVEHVMVVGHYGCGGVHAVAERRSAGLVDNWLRHVEDVALRHAALLERARTPEARAARLCELNVLEQVANVCRTTIVRRAWDAGRRVEVHGLVYALDDGLLRRVGVPVDGTQAWRERYDASLREVEERVAG